MRVTDDEAREMRDMLIEIRTDVKSLVTGHVDHEARLRVVEARMQMIIGIGAVVSMASGVITAMIVKAFQTFH